jgi:tripartite-type tricarboxylate transporter receptor subunit TctC
MHESSSRKLVSALLAGLCLLPIAAGAQQYPARSIRLVVPNPASGGHDATARVVAQKLAEGFGQQVVVDNRGGAGGMIGAEIVARAAPDGYTLLSGSIATHVVIPNIHAKAPYDPVRDFSPISLYVVVQSVLVAHPAFQGKTVQDVVALAKAKPGAVDIASAGIGSTSHLALALFFNKANIRMNHIPYKGGGPAFAALVGGEIPLYFGLIPAAIPHAKSGRLRIIAVGGARRSELLPEVPTVAESGVPGYVSGGWFGLMAPAGTPAAIVSRLHAATVAAVNSAEAKQATRAIGGDSVTNTPAEFAAFIRADLENSGKVIREANIKAE